MFENTFIPGRSKSERSIAAALVLQSLAITGLMLAPLLSVPRVALAPRLTLLPPAPQPARETPKPIARIETTAPSAALREAVIPSAAERAFTAPVTIAALMPGDPPPFAAGASPATGYGVPGADLSALAPAAPSPPAAAGNAPSHPVRLASSISRSQLVFGPKPLYPRLAVMARIEGTVSLEAVISRRGVIENLHLISGSPLLAQAAMDAVRQWRYRPLLLNGEPLEVITEIDVNFTLQR